MTALCEATLSHLGQDPLPPPLAEHLAGCSSCRAVVGGFRALASQPPSAVGQLDAIRRAVLAEPVRSYRIKPWIRNALVGGSLGTALAASAVFALGHEKLLGNRSPRLLVLGTACVIAGLLWTGLFLALSPRSRLRPLPQLLLFAVAGLSVYLGGSGYADGRSLLTAGVPCARLELTVALVPVAFALWALTRSAFNLWKTFLGAGAAGAAGLLALQVHCPLGGTGHLLLFHLAPWLALSLLAVPFRARLPSRSFAP